MICDKLKECVEKQFVNESIKNCSNKRAVCIETSDSRTKVKCEERKKKIYFRKYNEKPCYFI